jgi:hypothetical protein
VEEVKKDIDAVREIASEVKPLSWRHGFGGEINPPLVGSPESILAWEQDIETLELQYKDQR